MQGCVCASGARLSEQEIFRFNTWSSTFPRSPGAQANSGSTAALPFHLSGTSEQGVGGGERGRAEEGKHWSRAAARERGARKTKTQLPKKQKPEKSHSGSPRSWFGTGQDGEHLLLVQARDQPARGSGPRVSPWSTHTQHPLLSLNTWVPQLHREDKKNKYWRFPNAGDCCPLPPCHPAPHGTELGAMARSSVGERGALGHAADAALLIRGDTQGAWQSWGGWRRCPAGTRTVPCPLPVTVT